MDQVIVVALGQSVLTIAKILQSSANLVTIYIKKDLEPLLIGVLKKLPQAVKTLCLTKSGIKVNVMARA